VTIKVLRKPNEEIVKQIREVELICKTHDKLNGIIYVDAALNYYPEINNLFLLYKHNKLISLISIFMPTANEAEISACTLPAYRRKGYFKKLLNAVIQELKKYERVDLMFVCEPQSKDGKKVIKKLGAQLCFTEYFLRYKNPPGNFKKEGPPNITLHEADSKDLAAIVSLSQQIFNRDHKEANNIITKALKADNIIQYTATLGNKLIGIAAVYFESDESSIFGLGISPPFQGKGLGKELLNLILEDLENRGIQNITIEVDSTNKNALNLYIKSGFGIETSYAYYKKNIANFK